MVPQPPDATAPSRVPPLFLQRCSWTLPFGVQSSLLLVILVGDILELCLLFSSATPPYFLSAHVSFSPVDLLFSVPLPHVHIFEDFFKFRFLKI